MMTVWRENMNNIDRFVFKQLSIIDIYSRRIRPKTRLGPSGGFFVYVAVSDNFDVRDLSKSRQMFSVGYSSASDYAYPDFA
ncbi:hypothetical protein SDC9_185189 [bioreactor metagenome]|uniref:Uncharacterized protein n=1 Tax=bioreactor metagenome TaxID=1076179 RepID=A0A645HHJ4_9ZZZZ